MTRDELAARLSMMPANADIVMSIGHYRIDVTGITHDAGREEILLEFPEDDMVFALERLDSKLAGRPERRNRE